LTLLNNSTTAAADLARVTAEAQAKLDRTTAEATALHAEEQ
jgi:hypothetical protein